MVLPPGSAADGTQTLFHPVGAFCCQVQPSTYSVSLGAYLLGILAILSNIDGFSSSLTFAGKNLFDWFDFISSAILMPIGGILVAIFVGYVMDKEISRKALVPYIGEFFYNIWLFVMKYLAPISVFIIMLKEIGIIKI